MRKIATVSKNKKVKRIMLYECKDGVYLFEYDKETDSHAKADFFYETLQEVYEIADENYGIKQNDWAEIHEPMEFCQHDRIEHVRIIGQNNDTPKWGEFEKLVNSNWVPTTE